jgi:hypothetical protein
VPLSELGRTTTTDLAMDDPMDHSSKLQEEDGDSWMNKIRRAYEQSKISEASGSILVAGTPSHSGSSEGSSQNTSFPHPDASQLLNDGEALCLIDASSNIITSRLIQRTRSNPSEHNAIDMGSRPMHRNLHL